ncbi:MAG TPA: hypothetical protein VJ915_04235 [Balneolaceae bacterium]|nr:hypothetical protein [Balneolaceae bacterium]
MKKDNRYISVILTAWVALGMLLSLAHNHFVDTTVDNGIEIQITKDTNECIICASHFKVSFSDDNKTNPITLLWERVELNTLSAVKSPRVDSHNKRAPPFVVLG